MRTNKKTKLTNMTVKKFLSLSPSLFYAALEGRDLKKINKISGFTAC